MKIQSVLLALIVLIFSLPALAGEKRQAIFSENAILIAPTGVKVTKISSKGLLTCDELRQMWEKDSREIRNRDWPKTGFPCIIEVETPEKEDSPTSLVRQDSSSGFRTAPPSNAQLRLRVSFFK